MKKMYILFIALMVTVFLVGCENEQPKKEVLNEYASDEILNGGIIDEIYYSKTWQEILLSTYKSLDELITNDSSVTSSFLYLNLIKYSREWHSGRYVYYKDKNGEELVNPIINIIAIMSDEKIGFEPHEGEYLDGEVPISFLTSMIFYPLGGEHGKLNFEKYHYTSELLQYDNVIYVTAGEKRICEIYYYSFFDISIEYFKDLFIENVTMFVK